MVTTEQYLTELVEQKNNLVDALVEKGIEADKSEKFNTLIPKVADIQGGGGDDEFYNALTNNGTSFAYLYYNKNWLKYLPYTDSSKVTTFQNAFYGCSGLLEVTNLNTSNANILQNAFYNCTSLTNVSGIDTSKATSIMNIFYGCYKLTSVSRINVSRITTANGLNNMFYNCTSLENIDIDGVIKVNINLSVCPLNLNSAKNILIALENYAGTANEFKVTASLSNITWELLDSDGETSPNGTTWKSYITAKGWNY